MDTELCNTAPSIHQGAFDLDGVIIIGTILT